MFLMPLMILNFFRSSDRKNLGYSKSRFEGMVGRQTLCSSLPYLSSTSRGFLFLVLSGFLEVWWKKWSSLEKT